MSYLVIAPCVVARDQDGRLHHVYEGGVIQWLSAEQAKHFLDSELVEETNKGVGGSEPADDPASGGKPASDATKAVLIDWIIANVAKDDKTDYTESELKPQNKDQLWELINSVED